MKRKQLLLLSSLLIFTGCDSVPSSTSSNNHTSVVDETIQLKNEITTYLNSINVENYKDDEKLTLQSMISSLQELVSSSNDKAQLEAAFSAFKTKYLSLKTKAEYDQEEKENIQVQFDNRKKELLDELTIDSETQYRIEELLKIKENQSALLQKVNEATTIEQLNEISLTSFKELLSSSKTNAQYTMEEILPYGLDSDWGLVNAHRDQMTLESDGTIKTKDDGYALDRTLYKGKMEIVFSVNTNNYCNLGGILLTTKSSLGDGLDGYVINIARQSTFEYYQVYYLRNFYASKGTQFYQYIGGWVYNNDYPNETVSNNKMRVIVERDSLRLYKEEDYQKYGESAKVCPVDLTNGGQFDVYDSYHFGIVTWGNGGVPFNLELDMLAGSTSVSSEEKVKDIFTGKTRELDLNVYDDEDKNSINNIISTTLASIDEKTISYDEVLNNLQIIYSYKNAKEKGAITIMDNIFSTDNSEQSSWDLVVEHAMSWTHKKGTNSVTTPNESSAGWQLTKDKYQDIDMLMNVQGCQDANPFNSIVRKAFYIGASSNGNYPKGYALALYQCSTEAWIQVHYMDGSGIQGTFVGGVCEWVNNLDIRVTVVNKELKIFIGDQQRKITNSSFQVVESITLDNYDGGSIGILNWDDVNQQTTFTLKEFIGTKIN